MNDKYILDYYHLSIRIKEARKLKGYTQEQLADIIGVSWNFIAKIETSNTTISLATFMKLANALDVTADYLLFNIDVTEKKEVDKFIDDMIRNFDDKDKKLLINLIQDIKFYKNNV